MPDESVAISEEKLHTLKTKAYFIQQFYMAYCKLNTVQKKLSTKA